MRILVTGGAGFIGSHLILKLLKEGHEIVCIDSVNDYYDPKLKRARLKQFLDKIAFYEFDIADEEILQSVFEKHQFDIVCHLAAQAGVRYSLENPFVYADSNYKGTLNIFEFSKRYKTGHVVYASTSSVYGLNKDMPFTEDQRVDTPISIYSASKRACELLAHAYNHLFGLQIIALRFFTVYGPFGRPDMALFKFTKNILDDKPIDVYNKGDMVRDFTYVTDIVQGFVKAMHKPDGFQIFNIGCGRPVNLMDYVKTLEKKLGKKAKLNLMDMQPGDVQKTSADISKAKTVLGYEPKVQIEEGIGKFVDWYLDYY